MNKKILEEYIDACALVEETEQELNQLIKSGNKAETVQDSVTGSMSEYPYAPTRFHLEGIDGKVNSIQRRRMEHILKERKAAVEKIKIKVEEWLITIPPRMQRIIKYKFFDGDTWEVVAMRIGRNATGDSIRKEFDKFLKEN